VNPEAPTSLVPGGATGPTVPATTGAGLGSGAMFDRIAHRYDLLNRVLSLGIDRGWRKKTVRALALADRPTRALDLATGTADLALAIARAYPHCQVLGTDPSPGMLGVGRTKAGKRREGARVELREGDAQAIAADDASFDAVTIAFGIRNVPDRDRALAEMARVTRPGGRVAILELSEPGPGPLGAAARLHVHHIVPRLGALLSGAREYRYLQQSIAAFPPAATFAAQMQRAGLRVLVVTPLSFGVCHLYVATPERSAAEATP
jgi:demethylmenaquinone methyltransferase/2-methoxy-6-polyprenyl-1,4-benzoquinol methylase